MGDHARKERAARVPEASAQAGRQAGRQRHCCVADSPGRLLTCDIHRLLPLPRQSPRSYDANCLTAARGIPSAGTSYHHTRRHHRHRAWPKHCLRPVLLARLSAWPPASHYHHHEQLRRTHAAVRAELDNSKCWWTRASAQKETGSQRLRREEEACHKKARTSKPEASADDNKRPSSSTRTASSTRRKHGRGCSSNRGRAQIR